MSEVAGIEHEVLLVRPAVRPAERDADTRACQPLDHAEQLQRPERLQQERVRAGGAGDVLDVVHPGQEDDPDRPRPFVGLELPAEREPVDAGQADVEHHHVGTRLRDPLLRLGGAPRLVDVHGDVLERRAQ